VQQQAAFPRQRADRRDLAGGVDGAELGALREGDDLGLGPVLVAEPPACRSGSSGVSLPSGAGTGISFSPATRSGAPHPSTLMCADCGQTTAPHRSHIACSPTTLAPLPLKTG
jgi:hypothetical protein